MELQKLYSDYIRLKFNCGVKPEPSCTDYMEYGLYEDNSAELFMVSHPDETFTNWMSRLRPKDPYYGSRPDWKPTLSEPFEQLDVYDEMIMYYLLFTINTTLSINTYNTYSAMNEFMKSYSFFQLSQLSEIPQFSEEQKHLLRDFFFFFYLYAHPVNEDTLYACSFSEQHLVHTKTDISLEDYFSAYHDHYTLLRNEYREQIVITAEEIQACKRLTLELLYTIEGRSPKLNMPSEEGLEPIIMLINNVSQMLQLYTEEPEALFQIMRDFLIQAEGHFSTYANHCFKTLLQNYASYILFFRFDEVQLLVDAFRHTPAWCEIIVSKLFNDSIFLEKIMRLQQVNLDAYPDVTMFFNEEARKMIL